MKQCNVYAESHGFCIVNSVTIFPPKLPKRKKKTYVGSRDVLACSILQFIQRLEELIYQFFDNEMKLSAGKALKW